jgi:hypothetical protein
MLWTTACASWPFIFFVFIIFWQGATQRIMPRLSHPSIYSDFHGRPSFILFEGHVTMCSLSSHFFLARQTCAHCTDSVTHRTSELRACRGLTLVPVQQSPVASNGKRKRSASTPCSPEAKRRALSASPQLLVSSKGRSITPAKRMELVGKKWTPLSLTSSPRPSAEVSFVAWCIA